VKLGKAFGRVRVLLGVASRTFGKCDTWPLPHFCAATGLPGMLAVVLNFDPGPAVLAQVHAVTALDAVT
jgi:hypothetical protein